MWIIATVRYIPAMRWEDLFADLDAQWEREQRADQEAELPQLVRAERAAVPWGDRAALAVGRPLTLVTAAGRVGGQLSDVGDEWLLMDEQGRSALVPAHAVLAVSGLPLRSSDDRRRARRVSLGAGLRGISRDRCGVVVHDIGGGQYTGSIDWVGADHLDLSEHPADALRRPTEITGRRTIPFAAIAVIRRTD